MAIYKVSTLRPRPGTAQGPKAGPAPEDRPGVAAAGKAWGWAGLSCGHGAGGVSGGSQSPQPQPEAPGQGFVHSHPVSDGPAEPLSAGASASQTLGEAGQGPAAAGSRAPRAAAWEWGVSLSLCVSACLSVSCLSVSLVAEPLSQTPCCTAEGLLQVPDIYGAPMQAPFAGLTTPTCGVKPIPHLVERTLRPERLTACSRSPREAEGLQGFETRPKSQSRSPPPRSAQHGPCLGWPCSQKALL